jgi:hypothetical protein
MATATGLDVFYSCNVPARSWCGFTTAAPPDILSSYSTYLSDGVSFWEANRETIAILSTNCASAWARPHMGLKLDTPPATALSMSKTRLISSGTSSDPPQGLSHHSKAPTGSSSSGYAYETKPYQR